MQKHKTNVINKFYDLSCTSKWKFQLYINSFISKIILFYIFIRIRKLHNKTIVPDKPSNQEKYAKELMR